MPEPKPRQKFWVTDPPATFDNEEEGVVLICVFSTRRLLKDFYDSQGLPEEARAEPQIRRYGKLKRDCGMIGWQGIAIDPDPETGRCRIIRFDGVAGVGATDAEPEPEEVEPPPPKSSIITDLGFTPGGRS